MIPSLLLRAGLMTSVSLAGFSAQPLLAVANEEEQRSGPALATGQSNSAEDQDEATIGSGSGEIVVQGTRSRGSLDVEQAPLLELGQEDIAAEGVGSIAELITQISSQSSSARGRGGAGMPVILINGIRVGSFREFANYPPEALDRVEVFPEEVAQRFGFPPDRRVINLILKDNYRNAEVELEFEGPSRGGSYTREQELGYLQIADGARINVNFTAQDTSLLTEDERGIIQTPGSISDVPGDPAQAGFRSLIADSRSLEGNISWAKALVDSGTSLSANANYRRSDTRRLQGLNSLLLTDPSGASAFRTFGEDTPLEQITSQDALQASGSLTRPINAFRLTSTFDAGLTETTQLIGRRFDTSGLQADALSGALAIDGALPTAVDAGFDAAFTRNINGSSLTTLRGPVAQLPGGELLATFDLGYDWTRLESLDTRSNLPVELTRGDLSTGVNLVVPITSRRNGFADALGSFTLDAQLGLNRLSDFGTLGDYTVGLNWAPFGNLDLSASYIVREVAPGLTALGGPQVVSLNVPVFDFVNGETVLANVTTGGNPDLLEETQRDWKFAANWELPFWEGARFTVEYVRNRSDNVTSSFPQITQEIEAAFPGRITRDAAGILTAVDRRAVTFAETRAQRLNFNLNFRGSIGGGSEGGERGGPQSEQRGPASRPNTPRPDGARPEGAPAGGQAGTGPRPGGPRGEQFAAFRALVCADDGEARIRALVARIDAGEDVSDELPGFDPAMAGPMLDRLRGDDGAISSERIAGLRERFCAGEAGGAAGGPAGAGRPQGGAGGPPAGFNPLAARSFSGFRYFVSLNHAIELENEILIAPGLAPLDQLDGQATSAFGLPRHTSRLEMGLFSPKFGMRISARYTGETRLEGSGLPGSSDIFFDDLATLDLRIFSEIGKLVGRDEGVLKNVRVSLRADNLFDGQRRVTDESGATPINYQPFLIDPVGRYVGVDIRKLF